MSRDAGLYKQLAELQGLVAEFRDDPTGGIALASPILSLVQQAGLDRDCPMPIAVRALAAEEDWPHDAQTALSGYVSQLHAYLQMLANRLFSEGLHQLGQAPDAAAREQFLSAFLDGQLPSEDVSRIAHAPSADLDAVRAALERRYGCLLGARREADRPHRSGFVCLRALAAAPSRLDSRQIVVRRISDSAASRADASTSDSPQIGASCVADAVHVRRLLDRNSEELDSLARALDGQFILPEAGGDLLRDGPGVLPTGVGHRSGPRLRPTTPLQPHRERTFLTLLLYTSLPMLAPQRQ